MLGDFDEGKRSCRFKLERHNNRRRRKVQESGEDTGTPAGENDKASLINGMSHIFRGVDYFLVFLLFILLSSSTWINLANFSCHVSALFI